MWNSAVVTTQLCLFILVLIVTLLLAHSTRTVNRKLTTQKSSSPRKTLSLKTSSSATSSPETSNHVLFWKVDEPQGYLSQWYHSPFTTRIHLPGEAEPRTEILAFPTAEHYMMASKALLFDDQTVFDQVLARGSSNADMTAVKALGREVHGFSDDAWQRYREEIVLNGSMAKFEYEGNKDLRDKLLATGDKIIAEASPRDRVWGIGFGEKRALEVKPKWGLNLLGVALMKTRERLRKGGSAGEAR